MDVIKQFGATQVEIPKNTVTISNLDVLLKEEKDSNIRKILLCVRNEICRDKVRLEEEISRLKINMC